MPNNLEGRLMDWLTKSGLPLEYFVYTEYRKQRFNAFQSDFVEDKGVLREIDVNAYIDFKIGATRLRFSNLIECKWSKEKPWVIFISKSLKSQAANISQSIANYPGTGLLWLMAGERELHKLQLFNNNRPLGFSGGQADFTNDSKTKNQLYEAVQSLVTKTVNSSKKFSSENTEGSPVNYINIVFPTIVVDGLLYESFFDDNKGSVELRKVNISCLHWKGSLDWKWGVKIDIVTKEFLPEYCENLKKEFKILADTLSNGISNFNEFMQTGNIEDLKIKPCSRGMIGLHSLFQQYLKR